MQWKTREMFALSKFAKSAAEEYLDKYDSVRIVFANGEEVVLGRRDAKANRKRIEALIENKLISKVYKVLQNGKETRLYS